jgi:methionyl aminopeptidase
MGVILKSERQITGLRKAGQLVAETYAVLRPHVVPGVTTAELDRIADTFIRERGAVPIYKGYNGLPERGRAARKMAFPASICVAINEVICHGIPSETVRLRDGDIIGIDIGVILDGWVGDACVTFAVGTIDQQSRRLLDTTEECLQLGIDHARPGNTLGDIGAAIQQHAESRGFSVVHEYVGHGVGRMLHEEPNVLHHGTPGTGLELKPGMVFTIEPMLNVGVAETTTLADGWTVRTKDGRRSAQFEHTVAITENGADILTLL